VRSRNAERINTGAALCITDHIVVDNKIYTVPRRVGRNYDRAKILAGIDGLAYTIVVGIGGVDTATLGNAYVIIFSYLGVGVANYRNVLAKRKLLSCLPLVCVFMSPINSLVIVSARDVCCTRAVGLAIGYRAVVLVIEEPCVALCAESGREVVDRNRNRLLLRTLVITLPEIAKITRGDLALGEFIRGSRCRECKY